MTSVRIAGLVGAKEASGVKHTASIVQVARWVHIMADAERANEPPQA